MPNHITNRVVFEGTKERISEIKEFVKSEDCLFDFECIIPPPDNMIKEDLSFGKVYDAPTWYDWQTKNWGTKWNSYNLGEIEDYIQFQTAWSMPHPVYIALSAKFPDIKIHVKYASEDLGYNCGHVTYQNGSIEEHDIGEPKEYAARMVYGMSYEEFNRDED